jgi:uncharacterized repeat protein (TIGR01451 family)
MAGFDLKTSVGRFWIAALTPLAGAALAPSTAFAATADLAITNEASAATLSEGEAFRYVLTVSNAGPDAANGTDVLDRIPNRVEFVEVVASQGSCSHRDRRIECRIGDLASGASARARIRVRAVDPGEAVNTARVSSDVPDPQHADNTATAQTNILPLAPAPTCAGGEATIVGTEGDDNLIGTDRPDVIVGLSGNDTIEGLRRRDIICGNGGLDTIKSQGGNDVVRSGGGDDGIRLGGGNDQVRGGTGSDGIFGGTGDDALRGIGGNDTIRGKGGSDALRGGGGDDVLGGGGGADVCVGGGGNDQKRGC